MGLLAHKFNTKLQRYTDPKNLLNLFCMPAVNIVVYIITFINHLKSFFVTRMSSPLLPGLYLYAINTLFWVYPYQEMSKVGIKSTTNYFFPGGYSLKSLWYSTPLSNYGFMKFGVILSAFFISLVPVSFFIIPSKLEYSGIILSVLYFMSPLVFSMAFVVGRYHAPSWFFASMTLALMLNEQFLIGMLSLVLVAITSSTVMFFCTLILLWLFITTGTYTIITYSLPAVFISTFYVFYVLWDKETSLASIKSYVIDVFGGIGLIRSRIKYKRRPYRFNNKNYLFFVYYFIFVIAFIYFSDSIVPLSLSAFALYIINCRFVRFADTQTTEYGLLLTTFLDSLFFSYTYLPFALLLFWGIFPVLYKVGVTKVFGHLHVLKPLSIDSVTNSMGKFISKAIPGSRIMLVFNNPEGQYERIFDGYRHAVELAVYSGYQHHCCVFPNWYMLFSLNRENDQDPWIQDCNELQKKSEIWKVDYIVYNGDSFECDFKSMGYRIVAIYKEELIDIDVYSKAQYKKPTWIMAKIDR